MTHPMVPSAVRTRTHWKPFAVAVPSRTSRRVPAGRSRSIVAEVDACSRRRREGGRVMTERATVPPDGAGASVGTGAATGALVATAARRGTAGAAVASSWSAAFALARYIVVATTNRIAPIVTIAASPLGRLSYQPQP